MTKVEQTVQMTTYWIGIKANPYILDDNEMIMMGIEGFEYFA